MPFPFMDNGRPGPGVPPDAPRKTGFARWCEIIGRDFGALWLSGALALAALAPYLLGLYFAVAAHLPAAAVAAGVLGGALAAPFLAALCDIWLRGARDEPVLWRQTWTKALRQNARQSLVPGALCGTVIALQVFALYHLNYAADTLPMLAVLALGLLLAFAFAAWLSAQVVLFSDALWVQVKNCVLLTLGYLLPSLGAAALGLAYTAAMVLLAPLSFLVLPLTNLWLPAALLLGPIYTKLEKTFDLEASIQALHTQRQDEE